MNTTDKCKNCGAERGLHHYETDQCPAGGREAPIGRRQEWKTTVFDVDNTSDKDTIAALTKDVRTLRAALEALTTDVSDCTNCDGTGKDHDGACRTCGGYSFNPAGDIRQDILDARAILTETK